MDSLEIANHPLILESENDGLIHTASQMSIDDPMPMDVDDDALGDTLEGQNDMEGAYSGLPEDCNLQDDLLKAFRKEGLSFNGSFYHSSLLTTPPNPCLDISGLGLVGLPLSERDAKLMISCAALAPFGHGERTVVDKDIRNTWEIEASRLSFLNPEWEIFLTNTVCSEVCQSLGVSKGDCPPKMELYKLLLYEKGSLFLPHQDTQKAHGMFATVMIVLPSAYAGGNVVLSHAATNKTLDFSEKSLLSTAVLAWYTDVKHEVKPIENGYRLALSYNLIHVAPPNVPRPCLPDTSSSEALLAQVLRKWRAKKYEKKSQCDIIAYLLDHEYSAANLKEGLDCLKGVDAHRVMLLGPLAQQLGFVVGLASLSHKVSECADDSGRGYRGRTPAMLDVIKKSTSISGFVDLAGASLLSVKNLNLSDKSLIPGNPFKNKKPDKVGYRRTVVFLAHREDVDDICYDTEGIPYAYNKLKESTTNPPTAQDCLWATRLIEKAKKLQPDHVTTLFEYFLRWKDLERWKVLMKSSCKLSNISRELLHNAWHTFSFDAVRASFEVILTSSGDLPDQMEFVYSLPSRANSDELPVVRAWCNNQSLEIMSTFYSKNCYELDVKHIPILLKIIQMEGLVRFTSIMMRRMKRIRRESYSFWLTFRRALIDERDTHHTFVGCDGKSLDAETLSSERMDVTSDNSRALLDDLIKDCLHYAARQWSDVYADPLWEVFGSESSESSSEKRDEPNATKIDRVVEVLEELIVSGDMSFCEDFFEDILKPPQYDSEPVGEKIINLYARLLPPLCKLLSKLNLDISAPPFDDFLKKIIEMYMENVLGDKDQPHNCLLRSIACSDKCDDCLQLDKFILDPATTVKVFPLGYYDAQTRQGHLNSRIRFVNDICFSEMCRRKSDDDYGLKVMKKPNIIEGSKWETRLQNAIDFLASIGPDDVIAQIMGPRYKDVTRALRGKNSFATSARPQTVSRTRARRRRRN